jgi:hypothetical protein
MLLWLLVWGIEDRTWNFVVGHNSFFSGLKPNWSERVQVLQTEVWSYVFSLKTEAINSIIYDVEGAT